MNINSSDLLSALIIEIAPLLFTVVALIIYGIKNFVSELKWVLIFVAILAGFYAYYDVIADYVKSDYIVEDVYVKHTRRSESTNSTRLITGTGDIIKVSMYKQTFYPRRKYKIAYLKTSKVLIKAVDICEDCY